MYSVYISDYKKDGSYVKEPALIFDTRSPAKDITVLDPVCDLEDSKAGSFTFKLPLNHWLYDCLEKKRTLVTIWRDKGNENKEKIIFEGVVTSAERDLYKNKTVYCEGFATFLNDTCQPRKEYFNISMKEYVGALIDNHNSKYSTRDRKFEVVWEDDNIPSFPEKETTSDSDNSIYEVTQYESTFVYLQDLQKRCKGHFIFTVNPNQTSSCKYQIKYIKDYPEPDKNAQEIRFGLNMLDYTDSYNFSNICTSILPIANPSNYSESAVGEIVAMVPDDDKVVGELNHLTEKITVDGVSRYEFTPDNINNGDYIYIINSWANRDYIFSLPGMHHLLKVVDKTKLAETVTDPNERMKAFKIVSRSAMVYWDCQLGDVTSNFIAANPVSMYGYIDSSTGKYVSKYVALYRRYECFPTVTNSNVYYLSSLNPNQAWLGNGTGTPDAVESTLAAQIWANRSYHVVSAFIPYYTYKGTVTNYADLPTTGSANDVYYVSEQGREGYYAFNPNDSSYFEIDAIDKSEIGAVTPGFDRLYATTRALNQNLIENLTSNYLYSVSYPGKELERSQMSNDSKSGAFNSINEQEFDIGLSSNADKYYKAHVVNVANWGGSLRTTIKKGSYSYKSADYSIGEKLVPSSYSSYSDSHDSGDPNIRDQWPNGYINNWLSYNRTGYHGNGVCINELTSGLTEHYDIHDKDAIYVTTRVAEPFTPNHGSPCLWILTDSSDQVIYCEPLSTGVTTEINTLIDKTDEKFAGAHHLIVNKWGNVDIEVHDYIKQTGGLTDYITAEGAEDYYYYSYEHHIDRTKVHEKGSLYVENPNLIDIYGRIERKVEFQNIGDPNSLVRTATNYLMNTQYDDIEINLTGVDMHNLDINVEAFDISKKYPVYSAPHGLNKAMPITSLRINLISPDDNEITLGETKTFAERLEEGGLSNG